MRTARTILLAVVALALTGGCGDVLAFDLNAELPEFVVFGDPNLSHQKVPLSAPIPPIEIQLAGVEDATVTLTGLRFTGVNTTSLLILDLASPPVIGGEFAVGDDATSLVGSAIQAYGAGSALNPLSITGAVFTGTAAGCDQNDDGRHVLWAEESFVLGDNSRDSRYSRLVGPVRLSSVIGRSVAMVWPPSRRHRLAPALD